MIRRGASAAALAMLATGAQAKSSDTLTLVEAHRMSAAQLATRTLGAAGAGGDFVEAVVHGDGGLMIHQPGLNSIDLYRKTKSSGFAGLCQVEGVTVTFTTSRYDTHGDPPHRVRDFWKFTRFAMLAPTHTNVVDVDWDLQNRDCARLSPVTNLSAAALFAVKSDKPVDAYFAMRALFQAQLAAPRLGLAILCQSHDKDWPICDDVVRAVHDIPIRAMHGIEVDRCTGSTVWCVVAIWTKTRTQNESRDVELTVRTTATTMDPPGAFDVTALKLSAGTTIDD